MTAATLSDIVRRFRYPYYEDNDKVREDWSLLPEKVAIQLNDTHPALAIPELMRLLVDVYDLEFDFVSCEYKLDTKKSDKWIIYLLPFLGLGAH